MQLADPPADMSFTVQEMQVLEVRHDRWAHLMAHAILLDPSDIERCVAFLPVAANDMHSDFTGGAERVCRKLSRQFRAAFAELPGKARTQRS
jgi:hypothetical protein